MAIEPYQLFDALDPATESALRSSIRRHGVLVPVFTDQYGNILDGHQRSRIADELGVDYDSIVIEIDSAEHAKEIAHTLNTDRRHLTAEQRRPMVAELREEGHSLRAIAGAVGVSPPQVLKDLSTVNQLTVPERVVGLDGKSRPATRQEPNTPEPPAWSMEEQQLRERLEAGETVVANIRTHPNLIDHATSSNLYVRIDRHSEWGNPFRLPGDGTRDEVIANYRDHYLPYKPSLNGRYSELQGKVLGCWCAPDPCHGDVLRELAE